MPDDTTIKATLATLTASGLDVDPWTALVRAAEAAGFDFTDASAVV